MDKHTIEAPRQPLKLEGMENGLAEDIVLLVLFLVSAAANSLALLVFCRRPGLRTISNRFVMNLLAANVLVSCAVAGTLFGERSGGGQLVRLAGDAGATLGATAALLAVLLIALDQHHAVTDPLRCHVRLLQRRPAALCSTAWAAAVIAATIRAVISVARQFYSNEPVVQGVELAYCVVYLVLGVLTPVGLVCVMYARIYRAARSSGLRARAHAASVLQLHEPHHLPHLAEEAEGLTLKIDVPSNEEVTPVDANRKYGPFLLPPERPLRCPSVASLRNTRKEGKSNEDLRRGLPAVSSAPSLAAPLLAVQQRTPQPSTNGSRITSIRCRISNASLFRYREESRAARVGLLTGALVMLYVPQAALAAVHAAAPSLETATARTACMALLLLAAAAAPFLFALRSRRVQREARRLLLPQKSPWARGSAPADQAVCEANRARAAQDLLRTLTQGPETAGGGAGGAGRGSFSSGGSTQLSSASDE